MTKTVITFDPTAAVYEVWAVWGEAGDEREYLGEADTHSEAREIAAKWASENV